MNPDSDLLSPEEVADWLGVAVKTLARWRSAGNGPDYLKISERAIRYRRSVVSSWVDGTAVIAEEKGA